ncbi:MAG: uroporphyrinogen-III synthase [Actinomycetota bacterium]
MTAPGPLAGRVVMVTRPRTQAGTLSELLRARGAEPVEAPTIRIDGTSAGGPLDGAVRAAAEGAHHWVVFTSAAGVEAWSVRSAALGAARPRARLAAVGAGTADALREVGLEPDLIPERFTTEALAEAFPPGPGRVLLPRADLATTELEEALAAKGWVPVRVDAYRTTFERELPEPARRALDEGRVDAVTFTSTSTVDGFVRLAGVVAGPVVACIGPVTAEAARRAGFRVDAVAEPHTLEGLVEALAGAFDEGGR